METHAGVGAPKTQRLGRFRRARTSPAEDAAPREPLPDGVSVAARRDAIHRRSLAAGDLLAAAVAVGIGVGLMGDERVSPWIVITLPLVILVSKMIGLYDRDEHRLYKATLDEVPTLFQVSALYALLIWLSSPLFMEGDVSKRQVLGLWALLLVTMVAARSIARYAGRSVTDPERCLVVGDATSALHLRTKLRRSYSLKAEIVGRVGMPHGRRRDDPPAPDGNVGDVPVLGRADELSVTLIEQEIERVIIAPGTSYSDEILDMIRLVKFFGRKVSVLPRLFEVVGSSVEFDDVEGVTLLGVRRYGLSRSSRFLKRAMDVVGATVGLIVLAPLFAVAAAAIKLTSPGPVFFKQKRIGRDGREFDIFKFRTMVEGADGKKCDLLDLNQAADGLFKIPDDPRITKVGRYLRKTSLDELPQLLNVLRGEMSLVGPRPLVVDEDRRIEGWQRRRLHLVPGMTGHWQILGSSRIPVQEMVKIDYLYGANWSLWMDMKILLRTVPYVVSRRAL